jgi:hypothetical protein
MSDGKQRRRWTSQEKLRIVLAGLKDRFPSGLKGRCDTPA